MDKFKFKKYKGNYDLQEFYSLMSKFFTTRKYRRLMPYLYNEENTVWYIAYDVEDNEVLGFINYESYPGELK